MCRYLHQIIQIEVGYNMLSGPLPSQLYQCSQLRSFGVSENNISGSIPKDFWNMKWLEDAYFRDNQLEGNIPKEIGNLTSLRLINLGGNHLTGTIPQEIGNLTNLQQLNLYQNNFTGTIPEDIGSLQNLEYLALGSNGLSGLVPESIFNISTLIELDLSINSLSGSLPSTTGFWLPNLEQILISQNSFNGVLPIFISNASKLTIVDVSNNNFGGTIPHSLGNLRFLLFLNLGSNNFTRDPSSLELEFLTPLANCNDLRILEINSNPLNGILPKSIGNLSKSIEKFYAYGCGISGGIPDDIRNLSNLLALSFSDNLSHNLFEGSIPNSIQRMVSLENLYLSYNNLSGSIPVTLEKLKNLKYFNVSYNNLAGLIPSGGPFENFIAESFMFNKALCGDKRFNVSPCPAIPSKILWIKGHKHLIVLCFGSVSFIAAITLVSIYITLRRKNKIQKTEELQLAIAKDRISFYELQHATEGYNGRNLLGQGSFGSVYKATLRDGRVVAVKVFNLQAEGAFKSFDMECEVLRNLRHRNITQVISSCSNLDFKAIVLEFMPNGSLENWLHSENHFLSFTERLSIMIDVASALHYLHSGYTTQVVHADLKPSNILLDESKVAHVSDFGIAKMLGESTITYTSTLATFGYIAPEYGSEGLVSTKCDVYSFGIVLMEVFTRKSPHDEMFNEGLTLHDWVHNSMESALTEIVDDGLLNKMEEEHFALVMDCVMMIMKVALNCTKTFSKERSDIGEVVAILNKIKLKL